MERYKKDRNKKIRIFQIRGHARYLRRVEGTGFIR